VFPHLSRLAWKYKDKGLKVIGLSIDALSTALHHFVDSQGDRMDYTVISGPVTHSMRSRYIMLFAKTPPSLEELSEEIPACILP